jgi:serine phosphatase RsbU (regulator of sigma subunit)
MSAGLVAAAALAAARAARRDGGGLAEQAGAVDDTVAASFPHSAFVTAVLAHLDLRSGVLRYVGAGHPPPLLVRRGRVVRSLTGGRRLPLGLGSPSCPVAEETLEPGDWLVVYTDGITEARDPQGRWFGEERLVDLLARAVAAGSPPPETVRRLVQAVLEHQRGLLQDDATVLLLCWHGRSSD